LRLCGTSMHSVFRKRRTHSAEDGTDLGGAFFWFTHNHVDTRPTVRDCAPMCDVACTVASWDTIKTFVFYKEAFRSIKFNAPSSHAARTIAHTPTSSPIVEHVKRVEVKLLRSDSDWMSASLHPAVAIAINPPRRRDLASSPWRIELRCLPMTAVAIVWVVSLVRNRYWCVLLVSSVEAVLQGSGLGECAVCKGRSWE
jgi:hypothetical protein